MQKMKTNFALATLVAAAALGTLAVQGCTDDETTPAKTSSSSSSGGTDGGGSSSSSSSSSSSGSTDGGNEAATTTLNQRLGGKAGIKTAVDAIVAKELEDMDTASFFYYQVTKKPDGGAAPARDTSPSVDQLKDCLVVQLDEASGGTSKYAGYVSNGHTCRDMKTAHTGLKISATAFDKFVTAAAGVLKAAPFSLSDDDLKAVGGVLNGTKTDIVDPAGADKFTPPN
jgi:hypothetical protein